MKRILQYIMLFLDREMLLKDVLGLLHFFSCTADWIKKLKEDCSGNLFICIQAIQQQETTVELDA